MADQAALYHHTKEIDFGYEDKRFNGGLVVIQAGTHAAVTVGQIAAPGQKLLKTCNTCGETGHIAKDCPQKVKIQACNNCGDADHLKAECPTILCTNCRNVGHIARNCQQPSTCHTCHATDHKSKQCPLRGRKRKPRSTDADACTNCGEVGHALKDCFRGSAQPPPKTEPEAAPAEDSHPSTFKPVSVGDGSDGDASTSFQETPIEKEELGAPRGMEESPPDGGVIVKMDTVLSPNHISSLGFTLDGHYPSEEAHVKDGYEHKSASFYFTGANFQEETASFQAHVIDPTAEAFTKHVSSEQVAIVQDYVGGDSVLVHVRMCVSTAALSAKRRDTSKEAAIEGKEASEGSTSHRPLFGLSMFSNADFGGLQQEFAAIRDMLTSEDMITIDFFAVRSADEVDRALAVHSSMLEQHKTSPLDKWWKGGIINPQKGQEIQAEDRPTGFKIHKRNSFMNWEEYVTIHYHNLTHELEGIEAKGYVLTNVRLATFPGGGEQLYYAHLDAPPDTHFRDGASVSLKLMGPDAEEDQDWVFKTVESFGWTHAAQYTGFAFRPRLGNHFCREPEFVKGVHTIDMVDHCDSEGMFKAMAELAGIKCYVRENQPRVGVKRAINTLNHLHLGGDAFNRERQLLLANDLGCLPDVDYFRHLQGIVDDANIQEELDRMREGLGPEQQQVVDALRAMKGGILLVQGPGGVGKSRILVLLCRLQYRMRCLYGDEGRDQAIRGLWVVSSINKQLDDLAAKIYEACEQERELLDEKGKPVVVIRRHMGATEKHVYRKRAEEARAQAIKEHCPLYYDGEEADALEQEADFAGKLGRDEVPSAVYDLITAVRVQGPFSGAAAHHNFDKRLQLDHLSEGRWILRRAGIHEEDTKQPHEIAAEPAKYQGFRALLELLSKGGEMGPEEFNALTLAANTIVKELAELAVAICMTPDVVSQTRAHTLQQPFAVLHDMGTVAALIFSRPYVAGSGPLKISSDSHVSHILFGDIHQPPPVLGRNAQDHPFGQQNSVSVFQRWVLAGMQTVWLWEQHRSNQDIIDLINHTHPRGRMRVSDTVEHRPESLAATECAQEVFHSGKRVIFMKLRGKTEVLHTTKSRYNDGFVVPTIAAVCKVVLRVRDESKRGFHGRDIGIIAAYVAQVATYRHVVNQYRDWLMKHSEDSDEFWLGKELGDVEIFTVDKMRPHRRGVVRRQEGQRRSIPRYCLLQGLALVQPGQVRRQPVHGQRSQGGLAAAIRVLRPRPPKGLPPRAEQPQRCHPVRRGGLLRKRRARRRRRGRVRW